MLKSNELRPTVTSSRTNIAGRFALSSRVRLAAWLRSSSSTFAGNRRLATAAVLLGGVCATLAGCGVGPSAPATATTQPVTAMKFSGRVRGGQQPVTGAQLYLYAVGGADGGPAQSLLTQPGYVLTDSTGSFSITGDYSCPANSYVYLLAVGGNPGLGTGVNNAQLSLASLVGSCSSLTAAQFFVVNEITTVVAASALANIATSETQIGSSNLALVANASTHNATLIDPNAGIARLVTPDHTGSVPQEKIDSLADSIAACVNSDGTTGECQQLMEYSGLTGTSLTPDTFNAAILIAQSPARDPVDVFELATSDAPFAPELNDAPGDWTLAAQYSGDTSNGITLTPSSATIAPGAQVTLTATSSASGNYHWTTSGSLGTLTDPYGNSGQTDVCTSSPQIIYVSNGNSPTAPASDDVMVQQFTPGSCDGTMQGFATATITTAPPASATTLPGSPTQGFTATVVLPSGVNLPLDALTVIDSITQTTPDSSGTFTLPQYSGGPQIVFVQAPDGSPILAGWMDANHTTVDSGTTAEVLLYYALGGASMLSEADRETTIAQIPQINDFASLSSVVESELVNNVDAFAQPDANLQAALNSLFTETTGYATQTKKPGPRAADVAISPSGPQSGITITNTEPGAPYFTSSAVTPYSSFITNAYRRRTHYFLSRFSDTLNGATTSSAAAISDADVSATVGLTGGVTGALTDIIKAYFGNQTSAYAPVTSDPLELPVDSGEDATTYQIINVGAGGSGAPYPVPLSNGQIAILVTTAVNGFVSDVLVPFVNNVVVNAANDSDSAQNFAISGSSRSDFVLALEKEIANVVNGISGEQDKIVAGDYKTVIEDLLFNEGTSTLVNKAVEDSLQSALPGAEAGAAEKALAPFNKLLTAAGAGLQLFDTDVYIKQLTQSDQADVWYVKSSKFKATLTPATTTLTKLGSVQLTATALGVSNSVLVSYKWTIAPQAGQSLVGTITGGGQTLPDSNNNLSVCSSTGTWNYSNNASAFEALTMATTDSVTVTIYQGANCNDAKQITNTPSAGITNNASPNVVINPPMPSLEAGENVALTATFNNPKLTMQPAVGGWLWQLQGTGGTVYGSLSNGDGSAVKSGDTFCSTSNMAIYTSTQSDPITAAQTDLVEATAYPQAGCMGTAMNPQPGYANVTTRSTPGFTLSPTHKTLQAGQSVTFSLTSITLDTTGFSYQWVTSGAVGLLTDPAQNGAGSGQYSFCTTSNTATLVTDPLKRVTEPVMDTVVVTAYDDAGCVADDRIGQPGTAMVTLQPSPSVSGTPTQMLGQMQASDGYVYAIGTYAIQPYNGNNLNFPFERLGDTLFRIHSDGQVDVAATFTHYAYDPYTGQNAPTGDGITAVVEGPDDALYGIAGVGGGSSNTGYFYKYSLSSGTVTVLHQFSNSDGSFGTDQYGNTHYVGELVGPLVLADDGNFYVGGGGGVVRITPAGQVSIAYTSDRLALYGPLIQSSDENLYGMYETPAIQDANGTTTTQDDTYLGSVSLQGSATARYDFGVPFIFPDKPTSPLVAGSDGAFYSTIQGERQGFGACETLSVSNNDPGTCVLIPAAAVFRFDPHGGYSTIYSFTSLSDGTEPLIGLVAGPDGNLYGGASAGGDLDSECVTFPTQYEVSTGTNSFNNNSISSVRVSDEGCGTIFRITPSGTYTPLYQFQDNAEGRLSVANDFPEISEGDNFLNQSLANLALDSAGDILGSSGYNAPGSLSVTQTEIFKLPLFPNGPIQMTFDHPTISLGTSANLTWNVSNAFSLTAQQCYAHGIAGTAGGTWVGKQTGIADSSGFHGSTTVTPTATGTYYYELTCGGTQSSVVTLTVQ